MRTIRLAAIAAVATAALGLPAGAAASVGQEVKDCTGGLSFGQVVSSAEPGFNLGQHQKAADGDHGGARAFVDSVHCGA